MPNTKTYAGVVLTLAGVVGYVVLALNDTDVQGLMLFLVPLVTYLLIGDKIDATTNGQNRTLHVIERQTNGIMDAKIRDGSRQALIDADLHPQVNPDGSLREE